MENINTEEKTTRKLVSIQKILKIESIENADAIEKATILGWSCVVKKGDFKEGDLCVYFEIDSMIPRTEWSKFLFHDDKKDQFRLRTIRLRGQVSQGLAMPVSILPDVTTQEALKNEIKDFYFEEGKDVTETMGVTKYNPPIPAQLRGTMKGFRPEFVPKTDEIRIQAEPQVLERHKGKQFYISEKIDGSSMTVYFNEGEFGVCSRKIDLKETEGNTFWTVARQLDLENKMRELNQNIAIQGELHGEGVQGNKYKLKGQTLKVFNVYDINDCRFLDLPELIAFCRQFQLHTVPIMKPIITLNHTIEELVELSKGISELNKDTKREGIVLRPMKEERDNDLGRLSFKVINPDFLLKYGE